MAAGMIYWLIPRLWNKPLFSTGLANLHFWLGTVGILLYVAAMWTSGITQGLMLNATTDGGTVLAYPNFLDTLNTIRLMMLMRVVGGGLYLIGWLLLTYNMVRTLRGAQTVDGSIEVFVEDKPTDLRLKPAAAFINPPVLFSVFGTLFACAWLFGNDLVMLGGLFGTITCVVLGFAHFRSRDHVWGAWYDKLIVNVMPFTILTFIAVAAGGLIQIIPTTLIHRAANVEDKLQVPYTPLELAGRDIYVREGCYNCHSQMIRTLVPDVLRYGDYSRLGESIYDFPYQWGSKRTGPDLARVGGKYSNTWHYRHMLDPRAISPGSNMPNYPWLAHNATDVASLTGKLNVQRTLGVPYPAMSPAEIAANVDIQSKAIAADLRAAGAEVAADREIVALIAYLQKLGKSTTPVKTAGVK
jgi:cytochrome c oxidase cbb3-type subunit I/II